MNAGYGLSVRWSLESAPEGRRPGAARLRRRARRWPSSCSSTGSPSRPGGWSRAQWFEGTYVFDEKVYRDDFQREFSATAAESAGSGIIGSAPTLIEPFEVVAIAEGPGRVPARPRPRRTRLTRQLASVSA